MSVFRVNWESWERGHVDIEADSPAEARQLFNDEYVGELEPYGEGLDIIDVEEMTPSNDEQSDDGVS